MENWLPLGVSVILSLLPVFIWVRILRHAGATPRKVLIGIFIGGTLTVIPLFAFQKLLPTFDSNIRLWVGEATKLLTLKNFLIVFAGSAALAVLEEIVKFLVVRITDKFHPEYIRTIGEALKMSIVSGLGFAFAENILYFYKAWIEEGFSGLYATFVFRSVFTLPGHMIFSGIFGYFFGIAKFASDFSEERVWEGKKFFGTKMLGKVFGEKTFEAYRERIVLYGLFLAMVLHAVFNTFLTLGYPLTTLLAIFIIFVGGLYIYYLVKTTAGHLLLSIADRKPSTMAYRDETVVLELLGMLMNEGKFEQVMSICDRLLEHDPDNNVVKLFKAKARDNQKLRGFYESLQGIFKKTHEANIPKTSDLSLSPQDEKVVIEVLDMVYRAGDYRHVLEIADRLLARNPESEGAKLIRKKAFDRQKLERIFHSLKMLFSEG